jgi:hypothetical protein
MTLKTFEDIPPMCGNDINIEDNEQILDGISDSERYTVEKITIMEGEKMENIINKDIVKEETNEEDLRKMSDIINKDIAEEEETNEEDLRKESGNGTKYKSTPNNNIGKTIGISVGSFVVGVIVGYTVSK